MMKLFKKAAFVVGLFMTLIVLTPFIIIAAFAFILYAVFSNEEEFDLTGIYEYENEINSARFNPQYSEFQG